MADLEFYKLSMTGEEADSGIRTGMEAGATSGVLLGDGNGGVSAATPGRDFGFPLLEGNGPPTGNTAANIGQHYFDLTATKPPYEYICVGLNANGFIWLVFGDTGNDFTISGFFASLEALEAAISTGIVPAPTKGVAYGIGEAAPYDVYIWDAVHNEWKNNGPLGASGGGGSVTGIPPHGDTGQVLKKLSDADYDVGWGEAVPDGSITGAKIAPNAVGTTQLSDNAVTAGKIANEAVSKSLTVTLTVAGWSNNQQTVVASGATATNTVFTSPAPTSYLAFVKAQVRCIAQASNSLTFQCEKTPTAALTVNVTFINK